MKYIEKHPMILIVLGVPVHQPRPIGTYYPKRGC